MENTLQIINRQNVLDKDFTVYGSVENPLFLAKDVAEWIDYSWDNKEKGIRKVSQLVSLVDENEKVFARYNLATTSDINNVATTSRKTQDTWFLTEDGLYEILMLSRKPIAKQFKKEVKKILHQIRLTGGYTVPRTFADALRLAAEQQEQIALMQNKVEVTEAKNIALASDVLTWADRKVIAAIVNKYGAKCESFEQAWSDYKKELLYKHSINLNSRVTAFINKNGKNPKSKLSLISDDELPDALRTAIAMCEKADVDISDIVSKSISMKEKTENYIEKAQENCPETELWFEKESK